MPSSGGCDGSTGLGVPFGCPYAEMQYKSVDQIRATIPEQSRSHKRFAWRVKVLQNTKANNNKRACQLQCGLLEVISHGVGVAKNAMLQPNERSRNWQHTDHLVHAACRGVTGSKFRQFYTRLRSDKSSSSHFSLESFRTHC